MRKRAFTLVELLVVVAIIALLISILVPALGEARNRAKRVVCSSNLRQIGVGIYHYWTEWNGRVPYVWSPMTNNFFGQPAARIPDAQIDPFDRQRWPESLPNQLMPRHMAEEPRIFACPSAINGWPRASNNYRYTYRPASINQPNGGQASLSGSYFREHFGFLDGRILWNFRMDLTGDPIHDAQQYAYSRGMYLRDLLEMRTAGGPIRGPHKGGIMLLNRDLQVEFRDHETVVKDLAPGGAGSRF